MTLKNFADDLCAVGTLAETVEKQHFPQIEAIPCRKLEATMNLIRHALLVSWFLAIGAEIAAAGRTQIVLQWLDAGQGSVDLRDIETLKMRWSQ